MILTREALAFVGLALAIAFVGAELLAFEVPWINDGIASERMLPAFFGGVLLYGSTIAAVTTPIAVRLVESCYCRPLRWLVIAGTSLLPYAVLEEKFDNVMLLALGPCCVVANLVERSTWHEPRLPVATMVRS